MIDVVSKAKRSEMMSGIRGKNTKPELLIRSGLHNIGYRYRLHYSRLPGKPDIVLPKHKAIVLVNGCFWHGHDCHLFKWPKTRETFWREKIESTRQRDHANIENYRELGWRVLVVWECALKGKTASSIEATIRDCAAWIESGSPSQCIEDPVKSVGVHATKSKPSF